MKKLLLLSISLLTIVGCETGDTTPTETAHLYAVGNNGDNQAYITKDGVSTNIGIAGYYVMDVFVDGDDVYTCGSINGVAAYTKNGIATMLLGSSITSGTSTLIVSQEDVYVAGYFFDAPNSSDHPVYWKNGVMHVLDVESGFKGRAYDMTIVNNDVYIAGYQHNFDATNPITNISYWKNEVLTTINSSHVYSFNWIGEISIAVNNNDVYLAVNERDNNSPVFNGNAYLIKNGTEETLIDDNSDVYDIFISGSDIYVCGSHIEGVSNQSVIWKNGEVLIEQDIERGSFTSMVVSNNNIFAVGVASNLMPNGTSENHGTRLINNVFELVPDFGSPVFGSGYMAMFLTE